MKILIAAIGSLGDVFPYIGLARCATARAAQMRAEDGVAQACAFIENTVGSCR
jgi:UDP:flavonoid glycosyltransferase YjiC (YdhE family)